MAEETKKGFYYSQEDCVGCKACQIACKDKNELEIGVVFREVHAYTVGKFPEAKSYSYAATCNHCEKPACVEVCPVTAMYVDEEDGTVQHDDTLCIGCQYCVNACPYGVPKYIESLQKTHKCDACYALRKAGEPTACVAACPMRALDFGSIEELRRQHPEAVNALPILPDPAQTEPCVAVEAKEVALIANPTPVIL